MATSMVRPQPAVPPRRQYQRRRPMAPPPQQVYSDETKGPVAQYAPPDDGGIEAYNKDAGYSDDSYAAQPYQAPPPPPSNGNFSPYTGNNVDDMISNDREFALGQGNQLARGANDRAGNETQVREHYSGYGDEVYDPLIGGRGGYNPDEARGINNGQDLDPYMTTEGDFNETYLTPEERNAMSGNPWDRAAFFNPDADMAEEDASGTRQRDAVTGLETGLKDAYGGDLGLSDEYSNNLEGSLSGTEGAVRGAYDPASLKAGEVSLDRIRMTPEEEQNIVTGAGITAGTGYRAATGDAERSIRAAGIDPIGGAAIRSRNERRAASAGADAMTQARVAASGARAGRELSAEGLRMGGERTAADLGTRTELELGDRRLTATGDKERLRLGTEQDLANRKADAARIGGQARIGSEEAIEGQRRQQRQYNTSAGTDIATGIERDAATRAAEIATNRQKVKQGNQATRFQQGATRVAAGSQGAQTVADARRADAKEGRQYLQTQGAQANQNSQNEYNRQANLFATTGQLAQGATANQQKKDAQPKWWEKIIGAGASAAGAYAGGG